MRAGNFSPQCSMENANAAGSHDDGVGRESSHFHASQVHGADAAADAIRVQDRAQKFPMLIFGYPAFSFIPAYLLVQRVEKLLACRGAGKCGAMVERAAKAAKIEQSFRRPVESDAHAIEQIDDRRRSFAHGFHWRLIGKEVAAIDRVVKVLPRRVAFTFEVLGGVDAALGANGM